VFVEQFLSEEVVAVNGKPCVCVSGYVPRRKCSAIGM
jgi:hypothetical protein